jgi:site-specific DNA recombinase
MINPRAKPPRLVDKVDRQIENIVQDTMARPSSGILRQRLLELEARKAELAAAVTAAYVIPPLLHPNLSDRWRTEIMELRQALEEDRCDAEAREAVRHMIDEIRPYDPDGELSIDVKGNLAAILNAASPESWQLQLALVAGTRSQLYLEFCCAA